MKTNLSSQIKLDRIPKRYYAPDGELELAALTRDEKVYTKIFEGSEEGSVYVAHDVAELIQKLLEVKLHISKVEFYSFLNSIQILFDFYVQLQSLPLKLHSYNFHQESLDQ